MILFFDSGVGGLVYMEAFQRRDPSRSCLYVADDGMFPYGEKDPDTVRERVVRVVLSAMKRYPVEAIVVACNTASVVALKALREAVTVPVVGTVPAVKPAAALTKSGHIAVLATNQTVHDPYTDDLVRQFARIVRVSRRGLPQLVSAAERYYCSQDDREVRQVISEEVRPRLDDDVDTVVLACTHFVRFRSHFTAVLGEQIRVVDSLDGVTRRLLHVLPERSEPLGPDESPILLRTGGEAGSLCNNESPGPWRILRESSP
ncbi:MAG: glutamate racemase [Alkalispirochaeta sp.]